MTENVDNQVIYVVQCEKCFKWREISTQEEYEKIRGKIQDDPFICDRKLNASCDDPTDIEYHTTGVWAMDQHEIPETPKGFKRNLVWERDFSKLDIYYVNPAGNKLRTHNEVATFIKENPEYKNVLLSEFNFSIPDVMEETIPEKYCSGENF